MIGGRGPEGGTYTSHGLMLPADLEEHRLDTDFYELHRRVPEDDQCEHARFWTDDCDDCRRPLMVEEIREALADESSPIYLDDRDCRDALRQVLGAAMVNEAVLDVLRQAVEDTLRPRQQKAADALREALDGD